MGIPPIGSSSVPPEPFSPSYNQVSQQLLKLLQEFLNDIAEGKSSPQQLWDLVEKMLPTIAKDVELIAQLVGEDSGVAKTGRELLGQMQNILSDSPGSKAFEEAVESARSLAGQFAVQLGGG